MLFLVVLLRFLNFKTDLIAFNSKIMLDVR